MNPEVKKEIALRRQWVREARWAILVARIKLSFLRPLEWLGVAGAHLAADDQRDIIGERQYAIEEFRQVADKMRRRNSTQTWDGYYLLDPGDGYDGWLQPGDQHCD